MSIIAEIHKDLEQGMVRLMAEHRDCLFAEAVRLCNDASLAEDLVSRTFAKAIQKIDLHDETRSLSAWLKAILTNLYRDDLKNSVVRGTVPVDAETLEKEAGEDWSSDEQILKNSDNEALRAALERLDPKYKQVVSMHYFSELPVKSIATLMKLPVGTVLWRLNIARKILARDLADKLGKKKPLAVFLGILLAAGVLFGAWQAVEAIFTPSTPTPTPTSTSTPTSTPTPSTSTSPSSSTLTTTKEHPPMNKIKGTLLAAATAVSLMSTAQADEPIPVTPDTMESSGAGTVIKVDGDYVLSFTNTANTYTFTIPKDVESIRYLVVAGGGSGGGWGGGGGGAGGMLENDAYSVEVGDILTINVGKGGARQTGSGAGDNGKDSSITNKTAVSGTTEVARAYGGGGGGSTPSKESPDPAKAGGSGGGANGRCPAGTTGLTICAGGASLGSGQGNAGGGVANVNKTICACGGGGAGKEADTCASTASGTSGGVGRVSNITGDDVTYAGGGAGASYFGSRVSGGAGGGGKGGDYKRDADDEYKSGDDGIDGLGGGGGGSANAGGAIHSGKGGDGIVIIRYLAPAAEKATIHFSYDPNTVTWAATAYGEEVEEGGEVDDGTTIEVVATPKDDYEYLSAPEGWTKNADGTITADFKATAPECTIPIPAATAIPFTMNFTPGANASYTATVEGQPVQNGAKIRTGKQIVVVVTPNTDCEYAAIPEGWSAGEVEGTLTRTITAGEGVPQLTIPSATAIDYVPVQFTSNGSAFFEATNAVGEKVAGRVRAGTEVFVKIWAGVGFVYTETPTGWTWETEGDAYTKAFTAVSGSTLTIQIPNAREIGGKWTKTIDAQDGYMFEANKDLVVVFTNVTKTHTMILPSGVTSLRYLVVGGGGSGGGWGGGGGGAGGFLTSSEYKVIGRTLEIKVGQGGARITDSAAGKIGDDSYIKNGSAEMRAYGGGGGGSSPSMSSAGSEATSGGSGGGANGRTGYAQSGFGICPSANPKDDKQGFKGGGGDDWVYGKQYSASGGGGAGGPGGTCVDNNTGAAGGVGRECNITETPIYYAGGGGGASYSSGAAALGGNGGGGAGGYNGDNNGQDGADGLGGGGGGCKKGGTHSGKGGDGVVIIRFEHSNQGTLIFLM